MAVDLKKKVGPLPLWAWVGVGGGALIGLYEYEKNKTSSTASTAAAAPATDSGTVTPDTSGDSGGSGSTDPSAPIGGTGTNQPGDGYTPPWVSSLITAIQGLAPAASTTPTGTTPTATTSSGVPITSIPIKTQFQLLASGQITASQLGPHAAQILKAHGGNVKKAIASRSNAAMMAVPAAVQGTAKPKTATRIRSGAGHAVTVATGTNGSRGAHRAASSHAPAQKLYANFGPPLAPVPQILSVPAFAATPTRVPTKPVDKKKKK
jgi:hypothetical protein